MCGQAKKSNRLMKTRRGTFPAAKPASLESAASPTASPSSPCLWGAARVLSRLEGVGEEERTPELTSSVTSDKLSALSGLPFKMRAHIAFRRPGGHSSWLFRGSEPGSAGVLGTKRSR